MNNYEKRMNRELRREADRKQSGQLRFVQSVINAVSEPIVVIGTDMRVKLYNNAAKIFSAISPETSNEDHCYRLLFGLDKPCDKAGELCPLYEVLETDRPVIIEHKQKTADGDRYYEIVASPLEGEDGDLLGIIETLREITDRKLAEVNLHKAHDELEHRVEERTADLRASYDTLRQEIEERHKAEEQLSRAQDRSDLMCRVIPSAVFTVDLDRRITSWNDKAELVTGYRREEVLGKKCDVFALKPCTEKCGVYSGDVKKPIIGKECEIRTKNGEVRIVAKNADLLKDMEGNIIGAVESFEDITDRKEVENQLRTERDKFMGMLSAMGQGMHILNKDYGIEYQNEVLRDHFGDKIGQKCYEVYKQLDEPCEICRMHDAIDSMEIQRTELLMTNGRYYEQSYAPFRDIDGATKVLILLRDITEEKAYQAETMRAGQLASIGELAAGVAHEINNPINGIINYAQILLDESSAGDIQSDMLVRVIKEGERISDIVKNLLSFARQHDEEMEQVDFAMVLDNSLALVKHQLQKDGIILEVEFPEELPEIFVNPQQLQQVVLNLLSNARHALNQRYSNRDPEKRLNIQCQAIQIDGKPFVRAIFKDFGTGIPKKILGKIFDPFFSSKKPGEGTGLGLSISHGIIKDFQGYLRAESKEGQFTTMTVDLPVHKS